MILDAIGDKGQIKRKYYQRVLPEDPSKDYYYIMRETPNTTALLIEYGFIDNANDRRKLQNNLLDYVEGVVEAVTDYIGVPYAPPGEIPNLPDNEKTYTVKRGDTLYSIARQFNTTVSAIKKLNNLTSNTLQIGQTLRIPIFQEETPPTQTPTPSDDEYIVKAGDSLYKIAQEFNTTVDELIEYNNLPTTILKVGQVLRIPKVTSSDIVYIVKKGDTLYKIANNYGVSVDAIKKLNNLTSNTLQIGQQLAIPKGNVVEETNFVVYQVMPGDTLYAIARKYNTTVDEIKKYNNLTSNLLTINQTLQIPVSETTTENITYVIKPGDTLYQIANNYGVTVDDIIDLNNLSSTMLTIGDTILIPNKTTDY